MKIIQQVKDYSHKTFPSSIRIGSISGEAFVVVSDILKCLNISNELPEIEKTMPYFEIGKYRDSSGNELVEMLLKETALQNFAQDLKRNKKKKDKDIFRVLSIFVHLYKSLVMKKCKNFTE